MKSNKKKVAVVSLVVCLVAILSLGSLAWFTANDSIGNSLKFDTSFDVDVYETNGQGGIIRDPSDPTKTIGQLYDNLKPGAEIYKDPTVVNKSSNYNQWIRMSVTVTKYNEWKSVVEERTDLSTIFTGHDATAWERGNISVSEADNTVTYTYYLKSILAPTATATLFTGVKIPESLTLEQAKAIGESKITIKAEAMQEEAGSSAKEAFEN